MYILNKYKRDIAKAINEILKIDSVSEEDIVYPPNKEMGDLSLPMFKLVKDVKKNPDEIAGNLMRNIKKDYISGIKVVGMYLNFTLKSKDLAKNVFKDVHKNGDDYGFNNLGKKKNVMIEYSNVNTHKQFHVGHLRNICYGDSINRILKANGYESIPVSYINDFGIHVAKTLWGLSEFYKEQELPDNKGKFLGDVYVRATHESEDNKFAKQMIEVMMKKIESREGSEYELWKKTRKWSIEQFNGIYKELDIHFQKTYYESEYIDEGRKIINDLIREGVLQISDGAVIANLEEYNLGVLVMLRSDGTATYPVADLALILQKIKDYKLDKCIYVVDIRQGLYFRQLFKLFELSGVKAHFEHLGYDFVKLPDGMMSSRSGNIITYEELIEIMMDHTVKETKERHEDWNDKKVMDVAKKISIGAIKFEMLKVGANQEIIFDIENALSFSGFTSAYLQYTYARINSIINKSQLKDGKSDIEKLQDEKEHGLVLKMAKYPEVVKRAGDKRDASEIAKYLFELSQDFNDYYHSTKIIQEDKDLEAVRLSLIFNISVIIKNGLDLLGIDVMAEM